MCNRNVFGALTFLKFTDGKVQIQFISDNDKQQKRVQIYTLSNFFGFKANQYLFFLSPQHFLDAAQLFF